MMHDQRFTGRLGANIDVKTSQKNGKSYANFNIACDDGKKGSEYHKTIWLPFSANGKLAENIAASFKKGDMVEIIATADTYEQTLNIDGEEKIRTSVVFRARDVLASTRYATVEVTKNPFEDDNRAAPAAQSAAKQESTPAPAPAPAKAKVGAGAPAGSDDDDDDF